jgi:hypothetical protein
MKSLSVFLLLFTITIFAQSPIEKFSDKLKIEVLNSQPNSELLIWVFFNDKGPNAENLLLYPDQIVSEKSLKRRSKVLPTNQLISSIDLPVNENYISQLQALGFKLKHKSKWFNAVSGFISVDKLNSLAVLNFITKLDKVAKLGKSKNNIEFEKPIIESGSFPFQPQGIHTYNYGSSFTQMNQVNVPAVHDLGYKGQGVTICVMDAGFSNLTHEAFSTMNIVAKWDFVDNDPDVSGHSHGTNTLSVIGGFKQGQLLGPAFASNYLLARTENDPGSETPIEEDNWIAAIEWADSIGVDVTSTSLGYLTFDPPYQSYTWEDMDGNTAKITIAADLAVGLGITVVNSAGNNGFHPTQNTLNAPADGDSVLTIGGVTSSGLISSFSSVGNTVDGRIKPDFMAMASSVYAASSFGASNYSNVSGTSFSCPIAAGVAAIMLSYNPSLTPMQIRYIFRNTSSNPLSPNREYGWGILNALAAINFPVPVELTSFNAELSDDKVLLSWITATETNSRGFSIERARENTPFSAIGFVHGAGNSSSYKTYKFSDKLHLAGKYTYRLKQIDIDGSFTFSNEVEINFSAANGFYLLQNYPNPFNPSTKVMYSVPFNSRIKLVLFDVLGNEIKTMLNDDVAAGVYEFEFSANNFQQPLSSGIYFLKLETPGFQKSIKMVLSK